MQETNLPLTPRLPLLPMEPILPGRPTIPVGPYSPSSPRSPFRPCRPISPIRPFSPINPYKYVFSNHFYNLHQNSYSFTCKQKRLNEIEKVHVSKLAIEESTNLCYQRCLAYQWTQSHPENT